MLIEECGNCCRDYTCGLCGAAFQMSIKSAPVIDDPDTGSSLSRVGCPFCNHQIGNIKPHGDIPVDDLDGGA